MSRHLKFDLTFLHVTFYHPCRRDGLSLQCDKKRKQRKVKAMFEDISVENFRGDYEGLERMAHATWHDEYGQASFPNFYRPAFLHFLFDRIPEASRASGLC